MIDNVVQVNSVSDFVLTIIHCKILIILINIILLFRLYEDGMLTPPRRGEKMLTKLSVDTAPSTGSAGGVFLSSSQPQTPTHVGDSPFTSRSNELKVFRMTSRRCRSHADSLTSTSNDLSPSKDQYPLYQ